MDPKTRHQATTNARQLSPERRQGIQEAFDVERRRTFDDLIDTAHVMQLNSIKEQIRIIFKTADRFGISKAEILCLYDELQVQKVLDE